MPTGLGLVKTARTTLRKVSSAVSSRGRCHTPEENGHLDRLAALASLSSAHVDDMVTALYPPVFDAAVRDNVSAARHSRDSQNLRDFRLEQIATSLSR